VPYVWLVLISRQFRKVNVAARFMKRAYKNSE
jgi:hypothetical protein